MRHATITLALAGCGIVLSLFTALAQAGDSKVNCNSPGANGKIANVLSRLDPGAVNVVHVSGYCHENLVIQGFDRLSLIGGHDAMIEDHSGGQLAVVDIRGSSHVVIQGFTIRGGNNGLLCREFSSCQFTGDMVEDSNSNGGINAGITVDGADVYLTDIVVRNVVDAGIALWGARAVASNVTVNGVKNVTPFPGGVGIVMSVSSLRNGPITIQYADGNGLQAFNGSVLDISALTVTDNGLQNSGYPSGVTIGNGCVADFGQLTAQRNRRGPGILLQNGSAAKIHGTSIISDNAGPGIFVQWGSNFINFGDITVTNNQFGVYVTDVSLAVLGGNITFTQNAFFDISCDGPPPGLVLVVGNIGTPSTDCVPPLAPAKVPKGFSLPHN